MTSHDAQYNVFIITMNQQIISHVQILSKCEKIKQLAYCYGKSKTKVLFLKGDAEGPRTNGNLYSVSRLLAQVARLLAHLAS